MPAAAKLWIVIARPDRLHAALVAAEVARDRFPGGCHLLREESSWWQRADWKQYADRFASITAFPRVETVRGMSDLARLYRETRARIQAIARLPVVPDKDAFLCLAGTTALANAAISAHPGAYKILGIARHMYDELVRRFDRAQYRFTTSGWYQNRIVEPLVGVHRTLHLRPRFRRGGDGMRITRFTRRVSDIFDAAIVFTNGIGEVQERPDEHVHIARFPSISELHDSRGPARDQLPRVVFFGTPFLLIQNLAPEIYAARLNECLDFIRRHHASACRLIYRPHPAEKGEATKLDLRGFEVEDDREVAELYFLKHFQAIAAVYSVSSTVSRVALNNGLNAYAFWPAFPFSSTSAAFFKSVMGDVPPEFNVTDLTSYPVAYAGQNVAAQAGETFGTVLRRVLDSRVG